MRAPAGALPLIDRLLEIAVGQQTLIGIGRVGPGWKRSLSMHGVGSLRR
ncbi:MAG: hypothetical protein M3O92_02955 [Actinomycetota bacterium]|nr:hypothetical protein [Actinomycetota bacterium]